MVVRFKFLECDGNIDDADVIVVYNHEMHVSLTKLNRGTANVVNKQYTYIYAIAQVWLDLNEF